MTYLTAMHVPLVKVRIARREHDFTKYLDTAIYDSDIYINQCNQYILSLSVRVDSWPWGGVQLYVMNAVKSGLLHGGTLISSAKQLHCHHDCYESVQRPITPSSHILISGIGLWITQRKQPTCRKSLTSCIT